MPGPYQSLFTRGDRWPENRRLHVQCYPNTPAEDAACTVDSTVVSAILGAVTQLFDADAISYCRVGRFPAERPEHRYPRLDVDDLPGGFRDYLAGTTDDFSDAAWCTADECEDLTAYRGVHLLVHGKGFGVERAGAEAVDCEHTDGTGFSRGVAAWTGAVDGHDDGLAANSAIHETLHGVIRVDNDPVQRLLCDTDGDGEKSAYEEHTLGAIDPSGAVSPMLTYHVDEHAGCGHPDRAWDGTYTQSLTDETKAAVAHSAANQCRPQPGVTEFVGPA